MQKGWQRDWVMGRVGLDGTGWMLEVLRVLEASDDCAVSVYGDI